ncbi:heat stress transcription factor A-1-like [Nicotiana tabacum]|uniref:Heat stress transcription factor n=1 Tax=Nicotiana tabacum TaxID=4097 RepID=A0A1S4ANQ3_TOBAC|nr:PREDICTED: heat stress transcription factor A-1-like [Nicotiana tabacum]XP_016478372.1 PREDICTED: heat stress transcription factor A-1-like [Nicotiana tabacum]XP_016478373.1 PREDICTED: heat stress transcription factor A-1-like [Nicotiana tabacum]XP_016478375.1 PREDICTED: heat stress transcription factor A-1-like [Nicotiana tabacum]
MEAIHEIGNSPPPFLCKTYDMVDDLSTDSVVSWSKSNNSFVVWNVLEFSRDILPKYFKHNNFSSFVRQLNTYGYRKVDPDCWEFANEGFLRGHKHLLKTISRRKPSQMQVHQDTTSQVQSVSTESCVEVGKFGIEEEVERLKRDKNVHMEELVKLKQQQQATDHCLENVGQRLHLMEQRQQQTMSFLAKALQSPGFIAELIHQQNEGNRRIPGMKKKRRFPNQEEEIYAGKPVSTMHDRQIVRYQPLMNEAAKALLQKILKTNASGRLETKVKNTNGVLTNHGHAFENTLDSAGICSRISGVTLPQLPTTSQSHLTADSGFPFNSNLSAIPEIQYSPSLVPWEAKVPHFPGLNALNFQTDHVLPEVSEGYGINTLDNFGITDLKRLGTGDLPDIDRMQGIVDGVTSIVPDRYSTDTDIDIFLDEMSKLPGINDIFWDQILSASPLTGDKHEIGSLALGDGLAKEEDVPGIQESAFDKKKHMSYLT